MTVFTTHGFLVLGGLFVLVVAVRIARDRTHPRRWGSASFWLLLAIILAAGDALPPVVVGYAVAAMALLAAARQVSPPHLREVAPEARQREAARRGGRLLWPVLLVPAVAIGTSLFLSEVVFGPVQLVRTAEASIVGIGLGAVLALGWALRSTRDRIGAAIDEGGRLLQVLGWTLLLPQVLAALGGVFARAGVGDVIAGLVAAGLPVQHPVVAVVAYCAGMALFTILLGNAFAAFPVITLGVGLPFIVRQHGGDPAIMGALGMLSGYCGTLVTPMAANFNLVPVKLLELRDDFAVIRAQAPMAAAIWVFNVVLMAFVVYP